MVQFRFIITWHNYLLNCLCCHLIKSSSQFSVLKVFYTYIWYKHSDIRHGNCIDIIYADLGGLVVWYVKRLPGFNSQPVLVLSTVNSFQLMILVFQFLTKHLHIYSYKFSYRISDQEICSVMLYNFCSFSPIFSFFYADLAIVIKIPF